MNSEINYKIIQKQVTLLSRDTFLFSAMLQEILKSKNQRKICIFVLSTIISKIYTLTTKTIFFTKQIQHTIMHCKKLEVKNRLLLSL